MIKERNIVVCIILTILTCGIYGIFWYISLTDNVADLNDNKELSGGKALLFTIITCGIYSFFWSYKMGKELEEAGAKKGVSISDNSLVYLLLSIFGCGIIGWCIMQSDINKLANAK